MMHPRQGRADAVSRENSSVNRITRVRRGAAVLLSAALATGLLAGCTPGQVGIAASVGEDELSVSALQDRTNALLTEVGAAQRLSGIAQNLSLTFFVSSRVVERAAAEQGIEVTAGEVAQATAAIRQSEQGEQILNGAVNRGVPPSDLDSFVRDTLLRERIAAAAPLEDVLAATAQETSVQVSPRYGTFDPATLTVTPQVGGGLSRALEGDDDPLGVNGG
jgi:hypothetical protein